MVTASPVSKKPCAAPPLGLIGCRGKSRQSGGALLRLPRGGVAGRRSTFSLLQHSRSDEKVERRKAGSPHGTGGARRPPRSHSRLVSPHNFFERKSRPHGSA